MAKRRQNEGDATSKNEFVFRLRFAVKMRCRFGFTSRLRFTVEMRLRFTVTNHRRYDVEMRVQCERQTDITCPKSFWSVYLNKDVRQEMSGDFSNFSKAECTYRNSTSWLNYAMSNHNHIWLKAQRSQKPDTKVCVWERLVGFMWSLILLQRVGTSYL